jgi:glutamyl-tRNA reductase
MALEALFELPAIDEGALISTCNRTEAYAVTRDPDSTRTDVIRLLCDRSGMTADELEGHLFVHRDAEAVRHLFSVASGLHSMIVGEPQIAGQVKDAGRLALESGCSSRILNRLFRSAVEASKRARTETEIAAGAVSVSFAAVELARKIFGDLSNKTALVLGAGEMSELTARHLVENGVTDLLVASRTMSRAQDLADAVNGEALGWDDAIENLHRADIVISSTSAPYHILRENQVAAAMESRRNRQMFLIDIAVPRDIAPEVGQIYNVVLYDIDDLQAAVGENIKKRSEEAEKARTIVEEEVEGFEAWLASLDVQPAVVALRQAFHEIMASELERAKLADLTDEQQERVAVLFRQFTNKLLHAPTTQLKASAEQGDGAAHVDSLIQLFNLSEVIREGLERGLDARKVQG